METLGKESSEKWAAEFKRGRESVEDERWSGRPKDDTADVKVMHTLVMCDRRGDLRSGWGSTNNPNRHLEYVKGFGKMVAAIVDRSSEKDSAQYF